MTTKERILEFIESKGFNDQESIKIYNRYLKEKVIKIDGVTGGWSFIHGIFAEYDIMKNALF